MTKETHVDDDQESVSVEVDESGGVERTASELETRGGEISADDPDEGEGVEGEETENELDMFEDEDEGDGEFLLEAVEGFDEGMFEGDVLDEILDEDLEGLPECGSEDYEAPESVCGADGRRRIRATTRIQWRWSCQLLITSRNGRRGRCTGWFIGPRTVMTAGHCLYSHSAGGWARKIEVVPGMDANRRPYGSLVATSFRSVKGWTKSRKATHDYGAIILPNCKFKTLGYYGFASLSKSTLKKVWANNAGYAGDKPFGTLWYNGSRIKKVSSRRLYYMLDTYGGHSGSCVWIIRRKNGRTYRYAIGVHGYGGCPNKAVRIIRPVYNNMLKWKRAGRC